MIDIIETNIFPSNIISGIATGVNSPEKLSYFETKYYDISKVKDARSKLILQYENNIDSFYFQKQTHSDIVLILDEYNKSKLTESDAIITNQKGVLLNISIADCQAILLFDNNTMTIGAIHSGWKGTYSNIVSKTIDKMNNMYKVNPSDLLVYLSPSASVENYEVGKEFTDYFSNSVIKREDKFYFDNRKEIITQLLESGIKQENIESNIECTIENNRLHSYRRDNLRSGRMSAFIGMSK